MSLLRTLTIALFTISLALATPLFAQEAEAPEVSIDAGISIDELSLRVLPLTLEELTATAVAWQNEVKSQTEQVVEATLTLRISTGALEAGARDAVTDATVKRDAAIKNYDIVVDALAAKGGDPAVVEAFRQYTTAIVAGSIVQGDALSLVERLQAWAVAEDGGLSWLKTIGVLLVALIALMFVARVFRGFVRRRIAETSSMSSLLKDFVVKMTYWLVLAIGLMLVLTMLGYDISPLFAVLAGASFIVAFAMQETLGNLASGLMIMIARPFDVGDLVDAAGVFGVIEETSILATTIRSGDNQMIVVPNNKIWGAVITNVNAHDKRRIDLMFGISYTDDIDKALALMNEILTNHPLVLDDPAPVVQLHELADSSVNFICRPWCKTADYWTIHWDVTRQVKESFDANNISIPFPQQDLHLHTVTSNT